MGDYKKLDVWQRSHVLAIATYRATDSFPRTELYSLTSQMRRCAVSICANIVEGTGRSGDRELRRFIRISLGSAAELEYYVLLARDLQYLAPASFDDLAQQLHGIRGMLVNLHRSLNRVEGLESRV